MRVLLDTHAFLWLVTDTPNLSAKAKALFLEAEPPRSFIENRIKKNALTPCPSNHICPILPPILPPETATAPAGSASRRIGSGHPTPMRYPGAAVPSRRSWCSR